MKTPQHTHSFTTETKTISTPNLMWVFLIFSFLHPLFYFPSWFLFLYSAHSQPPQRLKPSVHSYYHFYSSFLSLFPVVAWDLPGLDCRLTHIFWLNVKQNCPNSRHWCLFIKMHKLFKTPQCVSPNFQTDLSQKQYRNPSCLTRKCYCFHNLVSNW